MGHLLVCHPNNDGHGAPDTVPVDRHCLPMVGSPGVLHRVAACIGCKVPKKDEETIRKTLDLSNAYLVKTKDDFEVVRE